MITSDIINELVTKIASIVGNDRLTVHDTDRVLNAHDAWTLSEAKLRAGELLPLADVVVYPESTQEVSEILKVCNELKVPVIPVSGGAGTCGGTLPIYGEF